MERGNIPSYNKKAAQHAENHIRVQKRTLEDREDYGRLKEVRLTDQHRTQNQSEAQKPDIFDIPVTPPTQRTLTPSSHDTSIALDQLDCSPIVDFMRFGFPGITRSISVDGLMFKFLTSDADGVDRTLSPCQDLVSPFVDEKQRF